VICASCAFHRPVALGSNMYPHQGLFHLEKHVEIFHRRDLLRQSRSREAGVAILRMARDPRRNCRAASGRPDKPHGTLAAIFGLNALEECL